MLKKKKNREAVDGNPNFPGFFDKCNLRAGVVEGEQEAGLLH